MPACPPVARLAVLSFGLAAVAAGRPVAAEPIFFDGFEPIVDSCSHPLVGPAGWDAQSANWVDVWSSPDGSPRANYPNSVGFPVPIGANKGKIRVVHFIPLPDQTVDVTWDGAQSNQQQGYDARPAMSMLISISTCGADVRPPDPFAADPLLRPTCRQIGGGGTIFFSTKADISSDVACVLEAGRSYFMNISPIDTSDGLTPGEHTCDSSTNASEQGCDVQAVHRGS